MFFTQSLGSTKGKTPYQFSQLNIQFIALLFLAGLFPSPTLDGYSQVQADAMVRTARLAKEYNVDPILAGAIIQCESRYSGNSNPLNKNGTRDHSYWQINDIHRQEALSKGFDIENPADNLEYGFILLREPNGINHWRFSSHCWSKALAKL